MTLRQRMALWTPEHWVLRLLVVVGLVGALVCTAATGHPPPPAYLALVAVLAVVAAVLPESGVGTLTAALVLAWWLIGPDGTDDALHPAVLVAAALLLLAHLAALLVSYGPDQLPVPSSLLRRWAWRALLVLPAAPITYAAAVLAGGRELPSESWVVGVLVSVVGVTAAAVHLRPVPEAGS